MAEESCTMFTESGHNNETCPKRGPKVFGVFLSETPIQKGLSSSSSSIKKSSWTEEEHKRFLVGLEKHGKGNWAKISRDFVKSRTSTQVASHAQKYFEHLMSSNRRKRRATASIFDVHFDNKVSSTGSDKSVGTVGKSVAKVQIETDGKSVRDPCPGISGNRVAKPSQLPAPRSCSNPVHEVTGIAPNQHQVPKRCMIQDLEVKGTNPTPESCMNQGAIVTSTGLDQFEPAVAKSEALSYAYYAMHPGNWMGYYPYSYFYPFPLPLTWNNDTATENLQKQEVVNPEHSKPKL